MLLVGFDPLYARHDPGRGHPERAARLGAVLAGVSDGLGSAGAGGASARASVAGDWDEQMPDGVLQLERRAATRAELERVHPAEHLDRLERFCREGGGAIDADTAASAESWDAAVHAAGAGLAAVEALDAGRGPAAFLALRPPGHHARPTQAMGFCLLNNVAVTAAALRERGERVLIVDWDAHHGNGTQDVFWTDPAVVYVSLHEWPLYPGTGRLDEVGAAEGAGATVNVPLPAGATGDVYLETLDTIVAPLAEKFRPTWVLVSAGYDAHRADPLTGLGLSAGDFADLTARVAALAPRAGRLVVFLEGGYDLTALHDSVLATVSTLAGDPARPEPSTAGGAGMAIVEAARDLHRFAG